jgi:hypothetical protein
MVAHMVFTSLFCLATRSPVPPSGAPFHHGAGCVVVVMLDGGAFPWPCCLLLGALLFVLLRVLWSCLMAARIELLRPACVSICIALLCIHPSVGSVPSVVCVVLGDLCQEAMSLLICVVPS